MAKAVALGEKPVTFPVMMQLTLTRSVEATTSITTTSVHCLSIQATSVALRPEQENVLANEMPIITSGTILVTLAILLTRGGTTTAQNCNAQQKVADAALYKCSGLGGGPLWICNCDEFWPANIAVGNCLKMDETSDAKAMSSACASAARYRPTSTAAPSTKEEPAPLPTQPPSIPDTSRPVVYDPVLPPSSAYPGLPAPLLPPMTGSPSVRDSIDTAQVPLTAPLDEDGENGMRSIAESFLGSGRTSRIGTDAKHAVITLVNNVYKYGGPIACLASNPLVKAIQVTHAVGNIVTQLGHLFDSTGSVQSATDAIEVSQNNFFGALFCAPSRTNSRRDVTARQGSEADGVGLVTSDSAPLQRRAPAATLTTTHPTTMSTTAPAQSTALPSPSWGFYFNNTHLHFAVLKPPLWHLYWVKLDAASINQATLSLNVTTAIKTQQPLSSAAPTNYPSRSSSTSSSSSSASSAVSPASASSHDAASSGATSSYPAILTSVFLAAIGYVVAA
ncbi:hypothetical protein HDU88_008734 [Geranomyces variabilis]|nr:hypothetical protein HDU88_008734 [Geranomyces variabilis]